MVLRISLDCLARLLYSVVMSRADAGSTKPGGLGMSRLDEGSGVVLFDGLDV